MARAKIQNKALQDRIDDLESLIELQSQQLKAREATIDKLLALLRGNNYRPYNNRTTESQLSEREGGVRRTHELG